MMKRTILALMLIFSVAYSSTVDAGSVKFYNYLYINNLQIIDLKTNKFPSSLRFGNNYKLRICVANKAGDAGPYYADTQLRIAPPSNIQFYTNSSLLKKWANSIPRTSF